MSRVEASRVDRTGRAGPGRAKRPQEARSGNRDSRGRGRMPSPCVLPSGTVGRPARRANRPAQGEVAQPGRGGARSNASAVCPALGNCGPPPRAAVEQADAGRGCATGPRGGEVETPQPCVLPSGTVGRPARRANRPAQGEVAQPGHGGARSNAAAVCPAAGNCGPPPRGRRSGRAGRARGQCRRHGDAAARRHRGRRGRAHGATGVRS
jgi:hypothetical protein